MNEMFVFLSLRNIFLFQKEKLKLVILFRQKLMLLTLTWFLSNSQKTITVTASEHFEL